MTDEAALLAAIIAHPDEDTPRLVYADCIEEQGQKDRAEFIRVQCELAKRPQIEFPDCNSRLRGVASAIADKWLNQFDPEGEALRKRERELWRAATVVPHEWAGSFIWSRGFISHIGCEWEHWRDHADAILARQPVRRVTLTTWPEWVGVVHEVRLKELWDGIEFTLPPAPASLAMIGTGEFLFWDHAHSRWTVADAVHRQQRLNRETR